MMLIKEVMTTGCVTVKKEDSVASVVTILLSRAVGCVPVIEGEDILIGIVTLRDVMLQMYPNYGDYIHDNVHARSFLEMEDDYPDVLKKQVRELMASNPLTVSPDDPILLAASYMGLKNFRRMPVAQDGRLVGVVSIGDIHRGLFFSRCYL